MGGRGNDRAQGRRRARGKPDRGEIDPVIGEPRKEPATVAAHSSKFGAQPQRAPPVSAAVTSWPTFTSALSMQARTTLRRESSIVLRTIAVTCDSVHEIGWVGKHGRAKAPSRGAGHSGMRQLAQTPDVQLHI